MIDILNLKLGMKEKKYVHDGFGGSNESDSGEIVEQELIDEYQPQNKLKVLYYIIYSDMDLTTQDIINRFNYSKNYATNILRKLSKSELIIFINGVTDKRKKIIKASEKGRLLVDIISKRYFFIGLVENDEA